METVLKEITGNAGLALEIAVVLIVFIGGVRALFQLARAALSSALNTEVSRAIWIDFATAILLALEFALGADIIRTSVAPTWDDIGQLAAIAAIRTGLGYFLGRDIEEFRGRKAEPGS